MVVDVSAVMQPGPWEHRMLTANGARFHAVLAGEPGSPLVVLLHGFPQFWWAWRAQIPALAQAGHRVVALDLRGFGASDKPPRHIATPLSCFDVAGVISALGYSGATVAGHGVGASVALSMPAFAPEVTRAVAAVSSPHPLSLRRRRLPLATLAWLQWVQTPWFPERSITQGDAVREFLHRWSANREPVLAQADLYAEVMRLPFAAHCAMEHLRWQQRSSARNDGRAYAQRLRAAGPVPTLTLHGAADELLPPATYEPDARFLPDLRRRTIPAAGHFLPEEAPEAVTAALLEFLVDTRRA